MNYFNRIHLLGLPVWLDVGLIVKPRIINLDKLKLLMGITARWSADRLLRKLK